MKKIYLVLPMLFTVNSMLKAQSLGVTVTDPAASYQTVTTFINETGLDRAIKIYPVPATRELNVKITDGYSFDGAELTITDITGKIVLKENNIKFNNSALSVNVQGLSNGVYTLYLRNNSNKVTAYKKFAISEK